MKITHVLPALTKGGAERVAADLANHAARAGHEISIIAGWPVDNAYLRDALHPDIRVWYIAEGASSKTSVYLSMLPWLWRHRSWLAKQDILHCHLTYGAIFGTAVRIFLPALGSRRPAILETCHSVGMNVSALRRWVQARMAEHFDAFALMAENSFWCEFIACRPALPSAIIPNGISFQSLTNVDTDTRSAYRRKVGIPDDCRFVVGTVGRLHPDRKPWLYIPLFAEIASKLGSEVHFVFAGAGPEYDHVRLLVAEHGLEQQFHFPGLILEPRLPLSIMDLYITLNVGAVTGIAGLEAAYSGLPVLAIQMQPDYKMHPEEWIWSSSNLSDVATRSIELLCTPVDRQILAGRQAAHVRSCHTVEIMARTYDALYQAAMKRSLV